MEYQIGWLTVLVGRRWIYHIECNERAQCFVADSVNVVGMRYFSGSSEGLIEVKLRFSRMGSPPEPIVGVFNSLEHSRSGSGLKLSCRSLNRSNCPLKLTSITTSLSNLEQIRRESQGAIHVDVFKINHFCWRWNIYRRSPQSNMLMDVGQLRRLPSNIYSVD